MPKDFCNGGLINGDLITKKFDVFSLGVVIIEIIAGRTGYQRADEMPRDDFIKDVS
jgi:hypothetical protein